MVTRSLGTVLIQIVLVDAVFSFDSILTAVGLVDNVVVMIIAVIVSIAVMMMFAAPVSRIINLHPTLQMLALSFLLLIGFTLIVEGLHQHIPKGYIYFAMGFSVLVEMLNLRIRGKGAPVSLHEPYREAVAGSVAAAVVNVPAKAQAKKKPAKKRR